MREKVVLLSCGSFNPVTNMHLRIMEIARDHLIHCGCHVEAGFISPVHDSYPKENLIPITHRIAMLKLATETSGWLQISTWESEQMTWTPTLNVMKYHQEKINSLLNTNNINKSQNNANDINHDPDHCKITVKLVCGADFLSSFSIPNLWESSHIKQILENHGMLVITRSGLNICDIIDENDILYEYMTRIIPVTEFIENTISSSKIRRACLRNRSIKYLVPDTVEQYIKEHHLYSSKKYKYENDKKDSTRITANLFNELKPYSSVSKTIPVTSSKNKSQNKLSPNVKKVKEGGRVSRRLRSLKRK